MQYRQVVGLLIVFATVASCNLFKPSSAKNLQKSDEGMESSSVICNDSIDAIVLNAENVGVYDMADFTELQDSTVRRDSLFNYGIRKNTGLLKSDERSILSFVISDKDWYIKDYAPVRQPFHPNIAFEFIRGRERAYMLVSFGTEEVAIYDVAGRLQSYQMREPRLMARWACMKFPGEEYYKELIKIN